MGQNTGTSNAEKNVAQNPKHSAFVEEYLHVSFANMVIELMAVENPSENRRGTGIPTTYQNLNSGRRLTNGLNSSLPFDGKDGPSRAGSTYATQHRT